MRHLLVPTDFSESAHAALQYAVGLCKDLEGRITLLHVSHTERVTETLMGLDAIENLSRTLSSPSGSAGYAPSFNVDELKTVVQQKLDACVDATSDENVRIETAFAEGRPSVKIVQYARDHHIDLIVMGTHGRSPVSQFFLGSVAENVIRSADCPVLTVRENLHACDPAKQR